MRLASALLALAVLAAPVLAQAGVHLHLPHKHRHSPAEPTGPAAPTSDVPDAAWSGGRSGR